MSTDDVADWVLDKTSTIPVDGKTALAARGGVGRWIRVIWRASTDRGRELPSQFFSEVMLRSRLRRQLRFGQPTPDGARPR